MSINGNNKMKLRTKKITFNIRWKTLSCKAAAGLEKPIQKGVGDGQAQPFLGNPTQQFVMEVI